MNRALTLLVTARHILLHQRDLFERTGRARERTRRDERLEVASDALIGVRLDCVVARDHEHARVFHEETARRAVRRGTICSGSSIRVSPRDHLDWHSWRAHEVIGVPIYAAQCLNSLLCWTRPVSVL